MNPIDYLQKIHELLPQFIALTGEVEICGKVTWTLWSNVPTKQLGDDIEFYYARGDYVDVDDAITLDYSAQTDMNMWVVSK